MRILVACEVSQVVTKELRRLGHEAYSCDILPCTGGRPNWHIQKDVRLVLNQRWDMIIAFPPCQHLAVSGAKYFEEKRKDGRQQEAIDFFMLFANHSCPRICIENPVGVMSSIWRKPDQIIQPYQFGHEAQKSTCLWLKNVRKLKPTKIVGKGEFNVTANGKKMAKWMYDLPKGTRQEIRSVTFKGIARAMANQFTDKSKCVFYLSAKAQSQRIRLIELENELKTA